MRILASNPDTLGDLILRQPLYAALQAAGHELMLIVRPAVAQAAAYVAPGAAVVELPYEPYAPDVAEQWKRFAPVLSAAEAFGPDILLIAPFRWTQFDERLAGTMPPWVKTAGMSGHLFAGDPRAGDAPASSMRLTIVAHVSETDAEIDKNAAVASALGAPVTRNDPRIAPSDPALAKATQTLTRFGLEPGGYWALCVSGTAHVALKTWQAQKWADFLGAWGTQRNLRKFLFVGSETERPEAHAVRSLLPPDVADRASVWAGGSLDELIALTSLSSGYAGHDTGPMHLAAALGKPVLGIFGGGTWPRFAPAVDPSVAVMVNVPCVGCGWSCSFETSHCIKDVPVADVLRAAEDLDAGRVMNRERRELTPATDLLARMTREAAVVVQREVRTAAQVGKDLQSAHRAREAERAEAERLRRDAEQLREGRDTFEAEMRRREAEAQGLRARVLLLEEASASQRAELATASAREAERSQSLHQLGATIAQYLDHGGLPLNDAPVGTMEPQDLRKLRQNVERLKRRVHEVTATPAARQPRPPRRPVRQVLSDLIVGRREYRGRARAPLPRISIVTPSLNDADALRRTIESVAAQHYPDVEFIVVDGGSTDATAAVLEQYKDRIDVVLTEPDDGPFHAIAKGFEQARGDVLHFLLAGDVLEPGGALRAAEYFWKRRRAQVVCFDDAVIAARGWRFTPPRVAMPDVYALLASTERFRTGVWMRRDAYQRIGGLNVSLGRAADWDLWLRLDRRWELRRAGGQVRSVRLRDPDSPAGVAYREDLQRARSAFLGTFGAAGRARCHVIHWVNRLWDALARLANVQRLRFGYAPRSKDSLPEVDPPAFVPGQPVSPLSDVHPDRFLFSSPDANGGDRALNYVYYDSVSGAVVVYPPVSLERLNALYEGAARNPGRPAAPAPPGVESPFKDYCGSPLAWLLSRVPSPWWWFEKPRFDDTTAQDLLAALSDHASREDASLRVLVVGCYEGQVLDALAKSTKWKLFGTETSERAISLARHNGHTVWETSPMDAASRIPVSNGFDVVFLNAVTEHLQDPLIVVRRLRQLLVSGGMIVINTPNLDSQHVKLFGPTWFYWQSPYHRIILGRRAVKRLARLADLKLVRFRTTTHPYPATASAQLNEVGLGGMVPDGAKFPDEISSRGVRLTGWTKLLWDWRGRGDMMYAVMKAT